MKQAIIDALDIKLPLTVKARGYVHKTLFIKTHQGLPEKDEIVYVKAPADQVILDPAVTEEKRKMWMASAELEAMLYYEDAQSLIFIASKLPWWRFFRKWLLRQRAGAIFWAVKRRRIHMLDDEYKHYVDSVVTPSCD